MAAVKSGWLWRRSSVLRRWKRNWFVLWLDGTLGYSRDEAGQDEEGRVLIRFNCRSVKSGHECPDLQPPEGLSRSCLLTVHLRVGPRLVLCADSEDDAVAWKTALLEASSSLVYNPYDDRYQPVPLDAHHVTFVGAGHYGPYAGSGAPVVVLRDSDPYGDGAAAQMALGMLAGAATGAALGSFLWMPLWF
ncbi:pleckstrin homology domain-containing family B member 1 [Ornithorhynchus anatinus]|uniref:pleckstrin homology domain-containing family B member 1 n=1 Tax=Ornithorhynchus anatinus TaxID=9258 RepID=UPI0010A7DA32|nr:pleckstrin homology domain-containing family B member 1 [Ornithorhynchus anatinus]